MKRLAMASALVLGLAGCASPHLTQHGPDLCLRSTIELDEGMFRLTEGRYMFRERTRDSTIYYLAAGHYADAGRVKKPDLKDVVRNVEAFWYTEDNADLCVNTFRRQVCVNVQHLARC